MCWLLLGILIKALALPVAGFLMLSVVLISFGLFRHWMNGARTWHLRRFLLFIIFLSIVYSSIAAYASRGLEPSIALSELISIFVKFIFGSLIFAWVCCLKWEDAVFRRRAINCMLLICLLLIAMRLPTAFQTGFVMGSLHSNYTGVVASSFILMQWYLFVGQKRDLRSKCLVFLAAVLLLMSLSRASMLALVFGLFSFYVMLWLGRKRLLLPRTLIVVVILFTSFATLNASQIIQDSSLIKAAATAVENSTGKSVLENGRFKLWEQATVIFSESPLMGAGAGARRSWERFLNDGRVITLSVHNEYLSVLTETGVIGLSVFIALLMGIFRYATGVVGAKSSLMLSSLAFCLTFGLFQVSMISGASMSGVWLWLVLGCAARVTLATAGEFGKT